MRSLVLLLMLVFSFGVADEALADEVKVKRSMFGVWSYSIDNQPYRSAGFSATHLRELMKENDSALAELDSYKKSATAATVFGVATIGALAWPAANYLFYGEWKKWHGPMLGFSVACLTISALSTHASGKHIKKAFRLHNSGSDAQSSLTKPSLYAASTSRGMMIGVAWRF